MKKNVIILLLALLILIVICIVGIKINARKSKEVKYENRQYEQYLEAEIYGTDVVTLMNKAMSSNQKNQVVTDEKGLYINNHENSITMDIILITDEEKAETTTYKMEVIHKVGITEFLKNFNTTKFKCTKKEYHQETGRIAHIELSQQSI